MSSVIGDIVEVGTLGLVKGEDITGERQEEAAQQAARTQAEAGQEAIRFQEEALRQIRSDLEPFRAVGAGVLGGLAGTLGDQAFGQAPTAPTLTPQQVQAPRTLQDIPFIQDIIDIASRETGAAQAARGKLFSGGTQEELVKRLAPAASALATDELNRQLASRGQFTGEQQGLFGQRLTSRGEQLGTQQQQFGQLFDVARLGQSAAAQQGAQQGASASNIGNLLTGIGSAQAAGQVGAAQARSGALGGLLGLGGTVAGAALGGPAGASIGGSLGGLFSPPPRTPISVRSF